MKYKKIVIIGTGLIGGSIGKALLERGLADEVVGVCRRQSTLERTLKEKAVSTGF
ncbi:MAG: NAD(P)-binding domain-containing protein, partial [Candidatus Omnitrophota bacterium]